MFDFSVFPMAFRIATQNCTFGFHNLGICIPILTWDISMNLWLNSLKLYIKIFLFKEGQPFNPFLCSIFLANLGAWVIVKVGDFPLIVTKFFFD